jgi:hypothetical protein
LYRLQQQQQERQQQELQQVPSWPKIKAVKKN